MKIRKFEWILRQFKEETRRLSSAKSSLVTQKWRNDAEIADYGIFETHSSVYLSLNSVLFDHAVHLVHLIQHILG